MVSAHVSDFKDISHKSHMSRWHKILVSARLKGYHVTIEAPCVPAFRIKECFPQRLTYMHVYMQGQGRSLEPQKQRCANFEATLRGEIAMFLERANREKIL